MRHLSRLPLILALLVSPQVFAQDEGGAADAQVAMGDASLLLQAGREEIIRDEMRLSDEEATAFWPAYDAYQGELTLVRNRYAKLLTEYLDHYRAGTVSEKFAEQLIDDYLQIQEDILEIKMKHLKDFRKALPPRKAARFYQLENKMEAELAGQLAIIIPLIDPV